MIMMLNYLSDSRYSKGQAVPDILYDQGQP